jgi:UDP-glucose 4-epimerase
MTKVTVLVTGGAGYIGSHAVLALRDAGWPVAVIDDLSSGSRSVVPADVPFYEGNVADQPLIERIFAEQGTGAIMHFAGSIDEAVLDKVCARLRACEGARRR